MQLEKKELYKKNIHFVKKTICMEAIASYPQFPSCGVTFIYNLGGVRGFVSKESIDYCHYFDLDRYLQLHY